MKLLPILIGLTLLCLPGKNFGQMLDLGTVEPYAFFTVAGAVSNTGTSTITGNIGTHFGIISGFGLPTTVSGSTHNADAATAQARIDLLNVYIILNNIPVTNTAHPPAFAGETITPGVFLIASAGSVGGTVTLDGQGNPDAVFIIKFEGAFTVGVGANIVLANGTRSSNVFWIAEGAISLGASVTMKGTLIAHPGAISMGPNCNLNGRALSTSGAITFDNGVASKPTTLSTVPIICVNSCPNPTLGSAANFTLFSSAGAVANTGISGVIGDIGSDFGAVSGWDASIVIGTLHNTNAVTAQAKIDLQVAYLQLFNTPATNTSHTPAFGSGETLTPGVYAIAAAGSLAGKLTLDGGGNPNSIFIFKFGGAFSTGAQSKVILINGARRCNIFWIAEGAISMGAFTFMKGTTIANNGANSMGANGFIEGRMFSTAGAVNFNTATTWIATSLCGAAPVILAVADTTAAVNGLTGGVTMALTSNDLLNGTPVVIGTAPGNVTLTGVTVPAGLTLNANGTVTVAPNTPAGNYSLTYKICEVSNPTNCSSVTSTIVVSAPVILAVADTTAPVNGLTGGVTTALTSNDLLNGTPVVIGTAPGNVVLTGVTVPAGMTLNANGTVTIAPNTAAGNYSLTYKICEVTNPTNCSTTTSIIVVAAPVILAVADTTAGVNGTTGGTTTSLTANDKLNGIAVVIGTAPGNVVLTGVTVPAGLTLNANGTVTVAPNTPVGNYNLTYKICEVTNPTNCSTVTSVIVVSAPPAVADLTPNITVFPNIMHGTTLFNVTIRVTEVLGNSTNGSEILVRVPRDPRVTFTFNPAATQIGFTTVNNSIWAYDGSDAFYHIFRTSTIIVGNSAPVFGFNATFTPGQSSGKYTMTASLNSGSGGETNTQNNNDAESADYFIN